MSKGIGSQLWILIDLVMTQYNTSNPIILSEKIKEDYGKEYSIHQISDHLEINRHEDYEKHSRAIKYSSIVF